MIARVKALSASHERVRTREGAARWDLPSSSLAGGAFVVSERDRMEVVDQAVATESAPVTTESAPASLPAGAQNTDQAAQNGQQPQYKSFNEHPEWQRRELTWQRRMEQQNAQWERRFADLQRQFTPQNQPRQATPEQQQALQALRELQALDPENAKLQGEVAQLRQMLQGLVQQQQTALTTQGRSQLSQMAADSGLPTDQKSMAVIENAVTVYLADNPEAVQRFRNHDLSVIKDAFKEFNDTFLGKLRRETTAGIVEKKTAAAAIPTPPRNGAPPGPSAPPKVTAANEQDVRAGMREKFRALLSGGEG